jgi:hypothetical protein
VSSNKSTTYSTRNNKDKIQLEISISLAASGGRWLNTQQKTFYPAESGHFLTITQIH